MGRRMKAGTTQEQVSEHPPREPARKVLLKRFYLKVVAPNESFFVHSVRNLLFFNMQVVPFILSATQRQIVVQFLAVTLCDGNCS